MQLSKIFHLILLLGLFLLCLILYLTQIIGRPRYILNFDSDENYKDPYHLTMQYQPFIKDRPLKIWFEDFWESFTPNSNFFLDLMEHYSQEYIIDSENPDLLIYSVFGMSHLKSEL